MKLVPKELHDYRKRRLWS